MKAACPHVRVAGRDRGHATRHNGWCVLGSVTGHRACQSDPCTQSCRRIDRTAAQIDREVCHAGERGHSRGMRGGRGHGRAIPSGGARPPPSPLPCAFSLPSPPTSTMVFVPLPVLPSLSPPSLPALLSLFLSSRPSSPPFHMSIPSFPPFPVLPSPFSCPVSVRPPVPPHRYPSLSSGLWP